MKFRSLAVAAVIAAGLMVPGGAHATGTIITNPFGNLTLESITPANGATPGAATLRIHVANGAAFSTQQPKIYFGLRLMGSEDMQMTGIVAPLPSTGCTVSDFAGNNTTGKYQGAQAFGTATPAGSLNSHMRMVGGFITKACGDIVLRVSFQAQPFVVYYAAFYGYDSAPWNSSKSGNYTTPPWNVVPTGGNATYNQWWNLWGTFTDLGYSNACVYTSGASATCA